MQLCPHGEDVEKVSALWALPLSLPSASLVGLSLSWRAEYWLSVSDMVNLSAQGDTCIWYVELFPNKRKDSVWVWGVEGTKDRLKQGCGHWESWYIVTNVTSLSSVPCCHGFYESRFHSMAFSLLTPACKSFLLQLSLSTASLQYSFHSDFLKLLWFPKEQPSELWPYKLQ